MFSIDNLKPYSDLLYVSLRDYSILESRIGDFETADKSDIEVLYLYAKDVCFLFGVDEKLHDNLLELLTLFNRPDFAKFIEKFEESSKTLFIQLLTMKLIIQSLIHDEETILSSLRLLEIGMSKLLDLQIKKQPQVETYTPTGILEAFKQVNIDG